VSLPLTRRAAVPWAGTAARAFDLEGAGALAACVAAAVAVNWRLLRPDVLSADALVHQYWMARFRDPALFTDPLTAGLRESSRYPDGWEALYRLASQVADPIAFGEWLGVALMALSGWLVFRIVREHGGWRPGAWIGAAVFLALIDIHRFYGGFPRAFVHPVVLLTVLLAMRRREPAAAMVAAGGGLFYAPAGLLSVGVLAVSAVGWRDRRPRLDPRRARFALLAAAIASVVVVGPQLLSGGAPRVFTADEARAFPEFADNGTLSFFASSPIDYLSKNRSGFDFREQGSILAVAALALLLARRGNLRLLRREVVAMPVVALAAFAAAQAVLFRLYLPHRYTYPLLAFFAIVVGVTLRPTWEAAGSRVRTFALLCAPAAVTGLALYAFPLGPLLSPTWATLAVGAGTVAVAAALAFAPRPLGASLGAAICGVALLGGLLLVPERLERGKVCPKGRVTAYLKSLPKDSIIAGDPGDLMCVPATARRPVVVSTQLAPAYEVDYFLEGRERMFADLRAYYGSSVDAIAALQERYGATHLLVRGDALRRELTADGARWRRGRVPYGDFVRRLVGEGEPAVLHLPSACRTFQNGPVEVYDIACITARLRS
jgi:hypothetical protein